MRYLVLLLMLPVLGWAQCPNCKKTSYSMVFKGDATALFRNEYRFTLEKTFWDRANLSWFASVGYFNYNNKLPGTKRLVASETFSQAWNNTFVPERDPFKLNTLAFTTDSTVNRENLNGSIFRLGLREYLTHISPYGLFIEASGSYSNIGSAYYNEEGRQIGGAITQAPGAGAALGYQFLMGGYGQWAFDFFAGLDYVWLNHSTRVGPYVVRSSSTQMRVMAGLNIGLALHH